MNKNILLIGGKLNGQVVSVPIYTHNVVFLPVSEPEITLKSDNKAGLHDLPPVEVVEYTEERIYFKPDRTVGKTGDQSNFLTVWLAKGITHKQAMRMLINNYRPVAD